MGFIEKCSGGHRPRYRDPLCRLTSTTFTRKADAERWVREMENAPKMLPLGCGMVWGWDGMVEGAPAGALPTAIDIERDHGVTITWDDGHVSRFGLEDLRTNCPCAQCRDLRQDGNQAWPRAGSPTPLRIQSARQVGNWGLNVDWNDGHTTGIYTWNTLRSWCPCEECEGDGAE